MEEKQEVFNPPQVLKLPRPSRSWPWFNSQQIRAAGNCEVTPSLSFSGRYIRPALWHYSHEVPEDGEVKSCLGRVTLLSAPYQPPINKLCYSAKSPGSN